MTAKKELEPVKEMPVAQAPAVIRGLEVPCTSEDVIIPRAKLFQGLPTEYEKYPDARPGQILNTATLSQLPEYFIPIIRQIEWIRFNARNKDDRGYDPNYAPGTVIWRTTDPNDPRVKLESAWGADGEPPLAPKFMSFLSYFPGCEMPVVVSFFKTSFNAGKVVNTPLSFGNKEPWNFKFKLSSKMTKSDQYSYYVLNVTPSGSTTPEEKKICEGIYEQFKSHKVQLDSEE